MRVKLTQGELKRQRDALLQYERYLPTLMLKQQQLQLEIIHQQGALARKKTALAERKKKAEEWLGLLAEVPETGAWLRPEKTVTGRKNIAGTEMPVFERVDFQPAEYDLFVTPLWVDSGLETLREIVGMIEEIQVIEQGISVLKHELRITTQRVNLFEKIKIPQAKEAIRVIRISIGDQMTNAVGRSKIAKKKIEETEHGEAGA